MNNSNHDQGKSNPNNIYVMIVSSFDSTYNRLEEYLKSEPKITSFFKKKGVEAVSAFRQHGLDVVIIDVSDPDENWITTISRIRKIDIHTMIIMVSDNHLGQMTDVKAAGLERGAAEYFDIPDQNSLKEVSDFKKTLINTIKILSSARRDLGQTKVPLSAPIHRDERIRQARIKAAEPISVKIRPYNSTRPEIIAIASSTGGPRALLGFFGGLPKTIKCPIVITQHMLKGFTASLANGITKNTDWNCIEGVDGMPLKPGQVYIAPHECHMTFVQGTPHPVIKLIDTPPENFCKPSADPMFRSLINLYGSKILAVVLTGMGYDGLKGAEDVVKAGGNVIAQDQETSVVWGMPRAVAEAGICCAVKPIDALPSETVRIYLGRLR
jgi:two-component system chemotaxis response regulator CheB